MKAHKDTFELLPTHKGLTSNYHLLPDEVHYADGYRELVTPTITEHQRLGQMIYVNDVVTYEVIDLTEEEVKNNKIQELNQQQDAELQPTDFYVIRANDPTDGRPIPQEIIELRKSIRDKFDIMKKAILILFFTLFSYSQEFGQIIVSIDPTATIKEDSPNLVAELELVSNWGYVKATTQILPAIKYFDFGAGAGINLYLDRFKTLRSYGGIRVVRVTRGGNAHYPMFGFEGGIDKYFNNMFIGVRGTLDNRTDFVWSGADVSYRASGFIRVGFKL